MKADLEVKLTSRETTLRRMTALVYHGAGKQP
jgi:hypothetical protein